MVASSMSLRIQVPFKIVVQRDDVLRIVADTDDGAFGLLPNRRDCVAALAPGILLYQTATDGEVCLAVNEGVLVKTGNCVRVSVRNAIEGRDLDQLRAAVEREFRELDEQERTLRSVLAKLESGFIRRYARLLHD
ncbi:ATP synthase epsilon chain [Castellaniella denitrificans]|uniref:F0F1 ATP synthase subunit epsilon n=1 Tax=Castellaniella sp. TaxID=1955812 RepID=UPI002AFE00D0|nr:F0F1 ATP synthase subunit epsilon [Castellaniella sp.]